MFGNTADFLGKVKSELKKVTWPTKKETLASTQVVIILTLIVAFVSFGSSIRVYLPMIKLLLR